ncbi:MAG: rhomboid family intramembrane serine protease [Sandaracinaceae bacterium]|nr:rhomboid family intramembrane serine protease [Sandaracinaceae bacterium]
MFAFPPLSKFIRNVLIVLFSAFVATALLARFASIETFGWLSLVPQPSVAWAWQVITYPFAVPVTPGSLPALLFTLFFLYLIGSPFEQRFGAKRTFQALVVSSLSAAVPVLVLSFVSRGMIPLFGASPMVFGLFVAFIASVRAGQVSFMGVLPMKPWHAIAISIGFSFLSYVTSGNITPFVADLGAIAGGYAFARYLGRPTSGSRPSRKPPKKRPFEVIPGGRTPNDPPKWLN